MNPNKLNRAQLVDFGTNAGAVMTAGGAGDVPVLTQTAQAAIIDPLTVTLGVNEQATVDALAAYRAAVQVAEEQRSVSLVLIQNTKFAMRAAGCAGSAFAAVGFDPPVVSPVPYTPQAPTDLAAEGTSNGLNTLRFTGNNKSGYVRYEIWRREGDSGDWMIIGVTIKRSYSDQGVTPGQYYEYKVRATNRGLYSAYSNSAVVYGI